MNDYGKKIFYILYEVCWFELWKKNFFYEKLLIN